MSGIVSINKTFFFTFNYKMMFLLSYLVPLQHPEESTDHDCENMEQHFNAMLKKASEDVRFYF